MLKQLRENAKLTQAELSKKINVKQATMSLYENGKRTPPLNKIGALAKALNVSEADIIACFK